MAHVGGFETNLHAEEEKQEQEFQNTQNETKALRKEDIDLISRINATADNGLDVAFGTRLRLAEQEERLHNTYVLAAQVPFVDIGS